MSDKPKLTLVPSEPIPESNVTEIGTLNQQIAKHVMDKLLADADAPNKPRLVEDE